MITICGFGAMRTRRTFPKGLAVLWRHRWVLGVWVLLLLFLTDCVADSNATDSNTESTSKPSALRPSDFQIECSGAEAHICPGGRCLTLLDNPQGKSGICSARCNSDADCGNPGSICIELDVGGSCLALCDSETCINGYHCISDGSLGVCFVH